MILKGSQRGASKQMATHLLKTQDNEHIEVHELRGFLSDDLLNLVTKLDKQPLNIFVILCFKVDWANPADC